MILIRKCKISDFDQVCCLLKQLWKGKRLNQKNLGKTFQIGLKSNTQFFICASYDNNIVGFCSLSLRNNLYARGMLAHIDELIIDEAYRSKKIGIKLVREAQRIAKSKDCKYIELNSGFHRKIAHKFYEKIGYHKEGLFFEKKLK